MSTSFPTAVAPSVRTPGLYLLINLLAGINGGGAGGRALLVACKASTGDITAGTEIRQGIAGADAAGTAFGPGTPGHLFAKAFFHEYPLGLLDIVCAADGGGAQATGTFTFVLGTPPVTVTRTITVKIAGRPISIVWNPGEAIATPATRLANAITALDADMPVTASPSGGVVTLTAKIKGTWGNDITISATSSGGAPADAVCNASGSTLTGGTLEADPRTALTTASGREYLFIGMAVNGNTDTDTAATTSAPSRTMTAINAANSGLNAKLQQCVVGVTGALSGAKTGAAQQNDPACEFQFGRSFQDLPAEICGAEVGARLREEQKDPAVNRIGMVYKHVFYGPLDTIAGPLTATELEDALQSGVSPIDFDASGNPRCSRPITTHWKDSAGNPDSRCVDVSCTSAAYAFARDLRTNIPLEFQGAKLSPDLAPGDDPPPPGVVEVSDVNAFVISRARFFVSQGWLDQASTSAAIANGEFRARVDPSNPSMLDLVIPETTPPPLAIISTVFNRRAA